MLTESYSMLRNACNFPSCKIKINELLIIIGMAYLDKTQHKSDA